MRNLAMVAATVGAALLTACAGGLAGLGRVHTAEQLARVQPGMTRGEVSALVGAPDETLPLSAPNV
jgi:outer membrane protein assembly factor BamE (lipoprotein component of BamABCDE complex)